MTNFDGTLELNGSPVGLGDIPPGGAHFWVIPSKANANNGHGAVGVGATVDAPMATIEGAIALMTDGTNDVLHYVAGGTSINLAAAVTWSNSYNHFVGHCAPSRVAQRARIFQTSTLTGADPLWTVSGSGCIFKNFYIFQGVDDATSLKNFSVTGERNYFENVHFAGGGHATQAINGGTSLHITGSENRFVGCTAGVDTIPAATGMVGILFDGQASRNSFERCAVTMYAGHIGAAFVEVVDGTGIDRYTRFTECEFINSNSDNFLMASGFLIPAYAANNSSRILVKDCMSHGVTTNDASDRGVLYGNMDAITAADLSGVAVAMYV